MIKVLNIFNQISDTNIPYELAEHVQDKSEITMDIVALKDNRSVKRNKADVNVLLSKNMLIQFFSLKKIIEQGEYDIIHTHHTKTALFAYLITKLFIKNCYLVHTVHSDFTRYNRIQKIIFKIVLINSAYAICNSKNTKKSVMKQSWSKDIKNICTIYNGVNLEWVGRYTGSKERKKCILSVGRMVQAKNQSLIIKAFSELAMSYSEWSLQFCGDGPLRIALEEDVKKHNLHDRIHFRGMCSRDEVYSLMSECAIYVSASLWEGFCNANVESMAAGQSIIASDLQPMPEVLGKAALYFNSEDKEDLKEKMEILISDENYRNKLGICAREQAKLYSIKNAVQNISNVYKELVV
jgi:glycosyltransferase involved in cell wall biosynthesis